MDACQCSSPAEALSAVPDPRNGRGKRHGWRLLLTLISAALVSGHHGVHAIARWVNEHAEELCQLLLPWPPRCDVKPVRSGASVWILAVQEAL